MADRKIRVPIVCPTCNGTGLYQGMGGICPQCHGTGDIGYAEQTQAEIEAAAWQECDRRKQDEGD